METSEAVIVPVTEFGEITRPFRNIRLQQDGFLAIFHLIPEVVLEEPVDDPGIEDEKLGEILKTAKLVVEDKMCLELVFSRVFGIAWDMDRDSNLFDELFEILKNAKADPKSGNINPISEVRNSPWVNKLPDWLTHESWDIGHYRFVSSECIVDVMGLPPSGRWIENLSFDASAS